ncbi:hypothetical protein GF324_08360, partial [bacterium]|nr:hypothetical protein [bacterium]
MSSAVAAYLGFGCKLFERVDMSKNRFLKALLLCLFATSVASGQSSVLRAEQGAFERITNGDGSAIQPANQGAVRSSDELDDLVYSADFASGTLPADWSIVDGGSNSDTWTFFFADLGTMDGPMLYIESVAGVTLDESVEMQQFDASGYTTVELTSTFYYVNVDGVDDSLHVEYSIDGGTSWTTALSLVNSISIDSRTFDLSAEVAGESNVRLRYRYEDNGGDGSVCLIDDVVVEGFFNPPPDIVADNEELVGFTNTETSVTATVTDNSSVATVTLNYAHRSGETISDQTAVTMAPTGNPNEYSATIPGSFHGEGDEIVWYIEAEDDEAATSRLPETDGEWFYYNVYDPALDVPFNEVAYRWHDITTSGTNLNLNNRQVVEVLFSDYGFDDFTWYGQSYDRIWVCANGWITFSDTEDSRSSFPTFPSRNQPNGVVSLFTHLFDVETNGDVFVGVQSGNFIIQFENVYFSGETEGPTGQIELSPGTEGVYLSYETADAAWTYDYDTGFENANGDLGGTIQSGTNWAPIESGTTYRIGHPLGSLTGTITDQDTNPLANVEVNVNQSGSLVKTGYSQPDGSYAVSELLPGSYDITAFLPGYTTGSQTGVTINSGQATTLDFQLDQQIQNVQITGTVESADTPDTPIAGIEVSIPALGISDITDGGGNFDLGTQPEGLYTIEISHNPAGSQGYHDAVYSGVDVNTSSVPLDLQVFEILPPSNLNATVGNERVTLTWDAPTNHSGEQLSNDELRRQIEQRHLMVDRAYRLGGNRDQELVRPIERELHMLRSMLAMREIETGERSPDELDDIGDFQYYQIEIDDELLASQPVSESLVVLTGLENFREYKFEVAADYGYGEEYLVFTDPLYARPDGGVQYDLTELGSWEWVEINPANGGSGTPLDLNYNQTSSFISMGALDYEHYGESFSQLAVSANGWISFLSTVVGYNGTLPSTSSPNAVLAPFWMNLDPGTGTDTNVWYLVDEANDRVIVQWLADTYPGPNFRRKSFQLILDCANNHATFNYASAVNGWTIDNAVSVGIEDRYGTAAVTIQRSNLTNQSSWRFEPSGVVFGNIAGTVTAAVGGSPIADATVELTGYPDLTETTDSDGHYSFLGLDRSQAPFEVVVTKFGFQESSVSGLGDPWGPDFEITQDFALSAATAPAGFSLLSPLDEDEVDTREPTLTWEEATSSDPNDPVTYDLIYSVDDNAFSSPDTIADLTDETYTFGPGVLTNYTTIYWYVHAKDANTAGTLSDQNPVDGTTWSFDIHEPFPPNAFDLSSPADEAVITDDATVTLEWNATTDPEGQDVTYRVFVSTVEGQLGT